MANCPECGAQNFVKNGRITNGKQRFLCQRCGRQFVENLHTLSYFVSKQGWLTDKTSQPGIETSVL